MQKLKFVLCFLALIPVIGNASLHLDPFLSYRTGSYQIPYATGGKNEYDISGSEMGLRVGFSKLGFMAGLQYSVGQTEDKQTAALTGGTIKSGKDEYDTTATGLFVGFSGIPFFRVWGTYFFNYKWETTAANASRGSLVGDYYKGTGYSLGVGFTGIPFLSLNLEYRLSTVTKMKTGGLYYDLPQGNIKEVEMQEILLGVSVPLNLF